MIETVSRFCIVRFDSVGWVLRAGTIGMIFYQHFSKHNDINTLLQSLKVRAIEIIVRIYKTRIRQTRHQSITNVSISNIFV